MSDKEQDFTICPGCGAPIPIRIIHSLYVVSFSSKCECGWTVTGHKVSKTDEPTPLSRAAKREAKRESARQPGGAEIERFI